jgi:hypothetical protein
MVVSVADKGEKFLAVLRAKGGIRGTRARDWELHWLSKTHGNFGLIFTCPTPPSEKKLQCYFGVTKSISEAEPPMGTTTTKWKPFKSALVLKTVLAAHTKPLTAEGHLDPSDLAVFAKFPQNEGESFAPEALHPALAAPEGDSGEINSL